MDRTPKHRRIFTILLSVALAIGLIGLSAEPVAASRTVAKNGTKSVHYGGEGNYYAISANLMEDYLFTNGKGTYTRVEDGRRGDKLIIETYNSKFKRTSKKTVKRANGTLGCVYSGKNSYFVVTSSMVKNQDYIVTEYDRSWKKAGQCVIYDEDVANPFWSGSCRMTEIGDYLFLHLGYQHQNGHQMSLLYEIDKKTMSSRKMLGYVASHSFNQFVQADGNTVIMADHGDGHPRGIGLERWILDPIDGSLGVTDGTNTVTALAFKGKIGDNGTGASLGGFEVSNSSYITVGNNANKKFKGNNRNIFVTVTPKSDFTKQATTVRYLTNFKEGGSESAGTPQLVKINHNRFMVLWQIFESGYQNPEAHSKICYQIIDGKGNPVTKKATTIGSLSSCQPIVSGKNVVWYYCGMDTYEKPPVFVQIPTSGKKVKHKVIKGIDYCIVTINGKFNQRAIVGQKVYVPIAKKKGKKFVKYKVVKGGVKLKKAKDIPNAYVFKMPKKDVKLKAIYKKK